MRTSPSSAISRTRGAWALVLLALLALTAFEGVRGIHPVSAAQPDKLAGTILVQFRPGTATAAIAQLNAAENATEVDGVPALGVHVLRPPAGRDAKTAAARYAHNPLVQFAEVNALVKPTATPNDPYYANYAWHLPIIGAPAAWDSAKATGVLIAICDTGVAAVPDLSPVLRTDLGYNTVDGSTNWTDVVGHGTNVAGVAAAATNNSVGVAGVAWGAQILPVRISNSSDGMAYVSNAAACITYAANHGARVINLSYDMAGSSAIDGAGQYAQGKGSLTTVGAGNDQMDPGWSNSSGFLAVAATDMWNQTTPYSNYGSFVDLAAPGSSVITTNMDGTYGYAGGTSISAPVAAGVIALIVGANPNLSAAQAQSILLSTADKVGSSAYDATGYNTHFGYGRVDASKAVTAALSTSASMPPSVSIAAPAPRATVSGTVSVAASASSSIGIAKVQFYVDGTLTTTSTTPPYSFSWNTTAVLNGSHTLTAQASDTVGTTATSSGVGVSVQNPLPSVSITSPTAGTTVIGTTSVVASASGATGIAKVQFYVDGTLAAMSATSPYSFTWNTVAVANGSHTLSATAYDSAGNAGTSATVGVSVQNGPQQVTNTFTGSVGGKGQPLSASYSVSVANAGSLSGSLSWSGKTAPTLSLYAADGTLLATMHNGAVPEVVSTNATAGSYKLTVSTSGTAKVSFTLTVTHY